MAERLFRAIGRADLIDDPRFRTNAEPLSHREALEIIGAASSPSAPRPRTLAFFEQAEVTIGPIYDEADLAADAYVAEREILIDLPDALAGRLPMHNIVPRLSATPGALRRPAPGLGEHNAEILRSLGCSDAEITQLTKSGVLARKPLRPPR